jgi:hypothetical protein
MDARRSVAIQSASSAELSSAQGHAHWRQAHWHQLDASVLVSKIRFSPASRLLDIPVEYDIHEAK